MTQGFAAIGCRPDAACWVQSVSASYISRFFWGASGASGMLLPEAQLRHNFAFPSFSGCINMRAGVPEI